MTNWDQESNTWKTLYVKCSLDPFFFIYRLESESEKNCVLNYKKNVIAEMVEAIMIADYRANVETSLSLARVKMIKSRPTNYDDHDQNHLKTNW